MNVAPPLTPKYLSKPSGNPVYGQPAEDRDMAGSQPHLPCVGSILLNIYRLRIKLVAEGTFHPLMTGVTSPLFTVDIGWMPVRVRSEFSTVELFSGEKLCRTRWDSRFVRLPSLMSLRRPTSVMLSSTSRSRSCRYGVGCPAMPLRWISG